MKTFYYFVLVLILMGSTNSSWASDEKIMKQEGYVIVPFNFSFVPGISVGHARANGRKVVNRLALNFVGSAAKLQGAEATCIWSSYSETVTGFQYSNLGNSVGQNVYGIQYAGIMNRVGGSVEGLQYAGIINLIGGKLQGLHWAGIVNIVGSGSIGAQFAGIANVVRGDFVGLQWSSIANLPRGNMTGGQWSGIINRVPGNMVGVQFSGIINNVSGTLRGAQFAGIFNRARIVKRGFQGGLFNYSRENHGTAIGLISYVKEVGLHLDVWTDATRFGYVGIRSGTASVHNLLFAGIQTEGESRWTVGWGVGGHFNMFGLAVFEIVGLIQHINEESGYWTEEVNSLAKLRLILGWQPAKRLAFYAGPTFNLFVSKLHDGADIAPGTSRVEYDEDEQVWARSWVGLTAGIRF